MMDDNETTAKELTEMLSEHGHHVCERTALPYQTQLGCTRRGSACCQMIHHANKAKQLAWARKNIGDDFSDCIYSDATTVQMESHH